MWLLDARSPRSDAECLGGLGQERFQWNASQRVEHAFTCGQHGFYAANWSSFLDLFCRQASLQSTCASALLDPATALIGLDVLIASWLSHRKEPTCSLDRAQHEHR